MKTTVLLAAFSFVLTMPTQAQTSYERFGYTSPDAIDSIIRQCGGILMKSSGNTAVATCPKKGGGTISNSHAKIDEAIKWQVKLDSLAYYASIYLKVDVNPQIIIVSSKAPAKFQARMDYGRRTVRVRPDQLRTSVNHRINSQKPEAFWLAHELAHHLLGHRLGSAISEQDEREADLYAGFLLGVQPFGDGSSSISSALAGAPLSARGGYPSKRARMDAALRGHQIGQQRRY